MKRERLLEPWCEACERALEPCRERSERSLEPCCEKGQHSHFVYRALQTSGLLLSSFCVLCFAHLIVHTCCLVRFVLCSFNVSLSIERFTFGALHFAYIHVSSTEHLTIRIL